MILERTAKGQTVFAQLLYAPRLAAQSAHAAPTQSRYTCDGAVKWYLLLAQAMPKSAPHDWSFKNVPNDWLPGCGRDFHPVWRSGRLDVVMRTRKRGTMALLVLQTKDVPMNTLAAKVSRQRYLFARFASVFALVACALLLLPAVARADGYSMTQAYISATVEADGSLTVVEGRQFDFDDDINGVFWETKRHQPAGRHGGRRCAECRGRGHRV